MAPVNPKQVKKATKKSLPFPKARLVRQPKDMRTRQLSNILAGLNYLRAPVVTCLARGEIRAKKVVQISRELGFNRNSKMW